MRWTAFLALGRLVLLLGKVAQPGRLVLVRHGQSTWNEANLFTGWADPPLTPKGWREAAQAAALLEAHGLRIDTALCSRLRRSSQSLETMLTALGQVPPVVRSWRLNEQHCGALTGFNKRELAVTYGEEQVRRWRRDPHHRPPPASDAQLGRLEQRRSCSLDVPRCESMLDACRRYRPLWAHLIAPLLQRGQTVLVVGHGNMLRGAVREIEGLSDEQLMGLEMPQGTPMLYQFDQHMRPRPCAEQGAQLLRTDGIHGVLLGDPESVRDAQARSAAAHRASAAPVVAEGSLQPTTLRL